MTELVQVTIRRSFNLHGEVCAPSSKAYTHRMLVAGLLSEGVSEMLNPLISEDTQTTLDAIMALGAKADLQEDLWKIKGATPLEASKEPINCRESGATARFMLPVAALAPSSSTFLFGSSLRKRPMGPLISSLRQLGAEFDLDSDRGEWVRVHGGGLTGSRAAIRGDISSQFISGLLFASSKAKEDTEIVLTTPLESKSYVKMTLEVLRKHDVRIHASNNLVWFRVPSSQEYSPCNHRVPGDFSSAAFLLAAAAITSSKVKLKNLESRTLQGDKVILDILKKMGSKVGINKGYVEVEGNSLTAMDIDVKDIPDLVPVLAVLACYSHGTSKLFNARRLRYKESNRLSSLYNELTKMGAKIIRTPDGLIVEGPCPMHGATINPHHDHRVAMACSVAALAADGETKIQDAHCIKKSYPRFFDDLRKLGGEIIGG